MQTILDFITMFTLKGTRAQTFDLKSTCLKYIYTEVSVKICNAEYVTLKNC